MELLEFLLSCEETKKHFNAGSFEVTPTWIWNPASLIISFDPEQVIYFNLSFPIYTTLLSIHELLLWLSKINYVKHLVGAWHEINLNKIQYWASLLAQWLRFWAPKTRRRGSIPGQGIKSHMPQQRPTEAKKLIKINIFKKKFPILWKFIRHQLPLLWQQLMSKNRQACNYISILCSSKGLSPKHLYFQLVKSTEK